MTTEEHGSPYVGANAAEIGLLLRAGRFDLQRDLRMLRRKLAAIEGTAGIGELHWLASELLRSQMTQRRGAPGSKLEVAALDPKGRYVAFGFQERDWEELAGGVVQVWEIESMRCVLETPPFALGARQLAWSQDGEHIATYADVIDVFTALSEPFKCLMSLRVHTDDMPSFAFVPRGDSLYVEDSRLGEAMDETCYSLLAPIDRAIDSDEHPRVQHIPNHRPVMADGDTAYLGAFRLMEGAVVGFAADHPYTARSRDRGELETGRMLVVKHATGEVCLDVPTTAVIALSADGATVAYLVQDEQGTHLVIRTSSGEVIRTVRDVVDTKPRRLGLHDELHLVFDSTGARVALVRVPDGRELDAHGGVTIYGTRGGQCSAVVSPGNFSSSSGEYLGFSWSPCGEACAVLDRAGRLTVFALAGDDLRPRATAGPLQGASGVFFAEAAVVCTHSPVSDREPATLATFVSPETGEVLGTARDDPWQTWVVGGRFAWPDRWLGERLRTGED